MGSGSSSINTVPAEEMGSGSKYINAGSVEGRGSWSKYINAGSVEGRGPGSRTINSGSDEARDTESRSINPGADEISQNNCDVCLTQKRASEARSFCVVCNEYLCQICEQAHRGSKASRNHIILTGSSIPSGSTHKEQVVPIMLGESHKTSLTGMTVKDKQKEIDLRSERVRGCTFMPDGHLVVACVKDGLKLFGRAFKYKSELSVTSEDVAVINYSDVIVTQGSRNQLQRVQVLPTMAVKSTIKIDRNCWGVDVYGGGIYVTCHDNPGHGEVVVLDINGQIRKRLQLGYHLYMFKSPSTIKISKDGSKLFVSDWTTHIVTCMNQQGQVIYRYSYKNLKNPWGMYVDGHDNLLVCGNNSNNVHVVRHDGKRERVLLSRKHGMYLPTGIAYRHSDGCLAVVMGYYWWGEIKLVVFTTNKTKI